MQRALDLHWLNANHVIVGIQSKPALGPPPSVQAVVPCSPHHSATPTSALHLLPYSPCWPLPSLQAVCPPLSPIRSKWVTCPRDFSLNMCCRMTALVLECGLRTGEQLLSLWSYHFFFLLKPAKQQKASFLVWSGVQIRNINSDFVDKFCTTILLPGTSTSCLSKG